MLDYVCLRARREILSAPSLFSASGNPSRNSNESTFSSFLSRTKMVASKGYVKELHLSRGRHSLKSVHQYSKLPSKAVTVRRIARLSPSNSSVTAGIG